MPFPPLIWIVVLIINGMARIGDGSALGAGLRSVMLAGDPPAVDFRISAFASVGINWLQRSALHGYLAIPDGFLNISFWNNKILYIFKCSPPTGCPAKTAGNQPECTQGAAAQRFDFRKGTLWNS